MPWTAIGVVDRASTALDIRDQFSINLDELREAHCGTLPALFDPPAQDN